MFSQSHFVLEPLRGRYETACPHCGGVFLAWEGHDPSRWFDLRGLPPAQGEVWIGADTVSEHWPRNLGGLWSNDQLMLHGLCSRCGGHYLAVELHLADVAMPGGQIMAFFDAHRHGRGAAVYTMSARGRRFGAFPRRWLVERYTRAGVLCESHLVGLVASDRDPRGAEGFLCEGPYPSAQMRLIWREASKLCHLIRTRHRRFGAPSRAGLSSRLRGFWQAIWGARFATDKAQPTTRSPR